MKRALKKTAKKAVRVVFTATECLLSPILEKRALKTPIDRPIIIIGPERSGTSFVYSLLAHHPDIYALSTAADRFPRHPFSASLTRKVLSLKAKQNYQSVPKTNGVIKGGRFALQEAVNYWLCHLGSKNGGWKNAQDDFFTENDLDDITRKELPEDLKKRLFIMGKNRLLLKQPGFSLKIRYLDALFPDALFVHCIRNPLHNFYSLMEQKLKNKDFNWGVKIPKRMHLDNASVEIQTAHQLAITHDLILESIDKISNGLNRYIKVRYEAFETDFQRETIRLFRSCALEEPTFVLNNSKLFKPTSPVNTFQDSVMNETQTISILKKLGDKMGYKL